MFADLLRIQHGVVSRCQALAGGLSRDQIQDHVSAGRWRRIFPGVYATFTGPVPRSGLLWAVLLRAGAGAVLSHDTAAELVGLTDRASPVIHITVPWTRTPARIPGARIHRSDAVSTRRHPSRLPPQTRVEETVLDLAHTSRLPEDAIAWLARAVGARLTTPTRLSDALRARPRIRSRLLLSDALRDVALGAHSHAELRYLRLVERAHRLPRSQRQVRRSAAGGARYDDVHYPGFRTRVELDGHAAHPDHQRWRDMRRDNAAVLDGDRVLRYGLGDLDAVPCQVAAQVATVLRQSGWSGWPRRCARADCCHS